MKPIEIIQKYYDKRSRCYNILIKHSELVTKKSLNVAKKIKHLNPDLKFIKEAAMLHDIGIFMTNAPEIDCHGDEPYVCHGYLGREILEKEGLPKHALVCERHIGAGIKKEDIIKRKLSLPKRNMVPISIEEKIICFADKFFSKNNEYMGKEKSIEHIKEQLSAYGKESVKRFEKLLELFS